MARWKAPAPDEVVYVVGDIHGCVDKLAELLDKIDDDMARNGPGALVFVGDYIDRGTGSADVLGFVSQMTAKYPERIVGLMGNHERMALDFLADPTGRAQRWLHHGGLETMDSFGVGIGVSADALDAASARAIAADLIDAMGADLVDWMAERPLSWSSGNLWVVHAAANPDLAMTEQPDEALLWGHGAFLTRERTDGQWVAFGHQPFDTAFAKDGRIACDSGAVYGGPLSAARIDPEGEVTFLTAWGH